MNRFGILPVAVAAAGVALSLSSTSMAADHRDAPTIRLNGKVDINDLYVFKSPANSANTVLMLTTNPFSGVLSPVAYSESAVYDIEVYNNDDLVPDVVYRSVFTAPTANGAQNVTIFRNGNAIATGAVGSNLNVVGGGVAHAGNFDDPFFFDLNGFNNNFQFTGDNAFANANTNAIVLEIPSTDLHGATTKVRLNSRTADSVTNAQFDRTGRPAINPALIVGGDRKDAFNLGTPATDFAAFGDEVLARITALSNANNAAALTPVFLPDLMDYDSALPTSYLNGRALTDDVIDISLSVLTVGAVSTDMVNGNDLPFSSTFPYLAPPIVIPEPASVGLIGLAGLLGLRRKR